jgi:iron complex transport system ATP-binding protein
MAKLSVEHLAFSYGKRPILQDISFEATDGDFIAVLGPNGTGKSTMFKCVLNFLQGYSGKVLIDGKNTAELSRKELAQHVAYIPQSSSQVFDYSVLELVLMGMAARLPLFQTPNAQHEARAMAVLEDLGIAHLAHHGCGQISGGEYQLVLLARTLLQDAKILIMDEPTANLDYGNQYRVMSKIAGLINKNFIVLMAAHDPNQVLLHANRALIVEGGFVRADGRPADVMTEDALSRLYGIEVHRHAVEDAGRQVPICIPFGQ